MEISNFLLSVSYKILNITQLGLVARRLEYVLEVVHRCETAKWCGSSACSRSNADSEMNRQDAKQSNANHYSAERQKISASGDIEANVKKKSKYSR